MRKTFKYFDHEGTGGISLPEIRHIFELMGFQLSEQQVLALFAT
jgi:Ca2+-binding EF-hand superfamily protein